MALAETTVWEVQQNGNDANGGAFNPARVGAGTDYSLSPTPELNLADLTVDATTNTYYYSPTRAPLASDIGNIINIISGTSWTLGRFEIVALAAGGTRWQLDRASTSAGQVNLATFRLGGAMANASVTTFKIVSGNKIFVKYSATPYEQTTHMQNAANGKIAFNQSGSLTSMTSLIGYDTNRTIWNKDANRPIIRTTVNLAGNDARMLEPGWSYILIRQLLFDANNNIDGNVVHIASGNNYVDRIKVINYNGIYAAIFTGSNSLGSINSNLETQGTGGVGILQGNGLIIGSTSVGFTNGMRAENPNAIFMNCIVRDSSSHGFNSINADGHRFVNCIAQGCGGNGFQLTRNMTQVYGCIAESNGGYGFASTNTAPSKSNDIIGCATYNNTSGAFPVNTLVYDHKTVTAGSVFVDVDNHDYTLNTIEDRGLLLIGQNSVFKSSPIGIFADDIGAIQDTSATSCISGGMPIIGSNMIRGI